MKILSRPEFFTSRLFGSAIRMAYWDINNSGSETVLLTHGEPSWSYLNRFVCRILWCSVDRRIALNVADG